MDLVRVGDRIEFSFEPFAKDDEIFWIAGQVVEIEEAETTTCIVQTSPFEPLQRLDFQHIPFKVLYEEGELQVLSSRIEGMDVEVVNDDGYYDQAKIKRVDTEVNCALLVYVSGKKEWTDMSLLSFKLLVSNEQCSSRIEPSDRARDQGAALQGEDTHSPLSKADLQTLSQGTEVDSAHSKLQYDQDKMLTSKIPFLKLTNVGTASLPSHGYSLNQASLDKSRGSCSPDKKPQDTENRFPTNSVRLTEALVSINDVKRQNTTPRGPKVNRIPQLIRSPPPDFNWYSEGMHVEVCKDNGDFIEGAVLCQAITDSIVHLYNEEHQFFELYVGSQLLKVIVHGMNTLTMIPADQEVEVYSPMKGMFRPGVLIKKVLRGTLAPVKFNDNCVEWFDLSCQTFKLIFKAASNTSRTQQQDITAKLNAESRPNAHKSSKSASFNLNGISPVPIDTTVDAEASVLRPIAHTVQNQTLSNSNAHANRIETSGDVHAILRSIIRTIELQQERAIRYKDQYPVGALEAVRISGNRSSI